MKKLLLLAALLAACTPAQKTIIVGTNAEFPPFEYLDNGKLAGFDIEYFNAIAQSEGLAIEWADMAFDGLIPALESKKIDVIMASLAATPERAKSVLFSESYYEGLGQHLIIKKSLPNLEGKLSEIHGKKLGVAIGTKPDTLATAEQKIEVVRFNSVAEAVLALQADKLDAVFTDADVAKGYLSQNENLKAFEVKGTEGQNVIGARHGDKELMAKINAGIKKIRSNGTYETLMSKYGILKD